MDLNRLFNSAAEAAERGDNAKAAKDYEAALQSLLNKSPGIGPAERSSAVRSVAFNLAQVLNKLGRYQDALKYVDIGLAQAPTAFGKAIAFAAKGEALIGLGRTVEGQSMFDDAAVAHPIVGRLNVAESMARLGTPELLSRAEMWVNTVETKYGAQLNDSQRAEIKAIRQQIAARRDSPQTASTQQSTGQTGAGGNVSGIRKWFKR